MEASTRSSRGNPDADDLSLLSEAHGLVSQGRALLTVSLTPLLVGFSLGMSYGNIGGVLDAEAFQRRYHNPSDGTKQMLAAIMQAGCVVGSIVAGWLGDVLGRRRSILLALSMVALSGAVLLVPMVAGDSLAPLFCGRLLIGIGGGIACAVVPLHVSEAAPAAHRGAVECSFQFAIEVGILAAYALNYLSFGTEDGWAYALAAPMLPSSAFLLWATFALPESPRFLVLRGRPRRAEAELRRLRTKKDDCVAEVSAISEELRREGGGQADWCELLSRGQRRATLVAVAVLSLQVGTGIDIMTVYAPIIFEKISPAGPRQSLLYTLFVGLTFCLVTPIAILAVDRVGRRSLLLAGGAGMCLSFGGLAYAYQALDAVPKGSDAGMLPTTCLVLALSFVGFFSFSWGPIPWIIPSELCRLRTRAKVVAAGTVANWCVDYAVISSFLSLQGALGVGGGFGLYAVINLAALAFVFLCVPETKGLSLEDIGGEPSGRLVQTAGCARSGGPARDGGGMAAAPRG